MTEPTNTPVPPIQTSSEPLLLGVNIDHCATLRQARYRESSATCGGNVEPDPVLLALLAEKAGADGITVHLREDRRHIQDRDIFRMKECLTTRMNLEMACTPEMVLFARETGPQSVCLVPENRKEITTEGGLDLEARYDSVKSAVEGLADLPIAISLFIDPDPKQIDLAAELKVAMVELHTGSFANHFRKAKHSTEWNRLKNAAEHAHRLGLIVNAGHGINYVNIGDICSLPHLSELNIGHSILSRALFSGIEEAVREMRERMERGIR